MNLIDRDAIPWSVYGVGEIPVVTKEEIEAMPVVEAIPIEFIIKRVQALEHEADMNEGDGFVRLTTHAHSLNMLMFAWAERKE